VVECDAVSQENRARVRVLVGAVAGCYVTMIVVAALLWGGSFMTPYAAAIAAGGWAGIAFGLLAGGVIGGAIG
jgi:hypothetical protein